MKDHLERVQSWQKQRLITESVRPKASYVLKAEYINTDGSDHGMIYDTEERKSVFGVVHTKVRIEFKCHKTLSAY